MWGLSDAIAEFRKAQEWSALEALDEEKKKPERKKRAGGKKAEKQRSAELLRRTQEIVKAHW